jgi:dCMP deaminase
MQRPSWDEYFITIAKLTSERSNCIKRKVGCIIVKDNRILCLGYNGTPRGMLNCFEGGCARCNANCTTATNLDTCLCLHAEENALLFLSQRNIQDATLYVTLLPCISCAKKIVQCKLKRVVYINNYHSELDCISIQMMESVGIIIDNIVI